MNFSEKLKTLRKQSGLSQEQLAGKIDVSRQAVTKWETEGGLPDIDNLIAIGKLFGVPLDELVGSGEETPKTADFFYESVTEYDILTQKPFDIHIGGAKEITLGVTGGEKVRVLLASNTIKTLERDLKVIIDDHDIDVKLQDGMTEARAKEALYVFISLPEDYLAQTELEAFADTLYIRDFYSETIEFDGRVNRVFVEDSNANVELNSSADMEVTYQTFAGRLEINQISQTSRVNIPSGSVYGVKKKGASTRITFERDGKPMQKELPDNAENLIEFRGMHAELVINEYTAPSGEVGGR